PSLVGEDPFAVARLWQRMAYRSQQRGPAGMLMQAISGVDIARWDLIGQAAQTPLARRFGAYRDELEAYASAGFCAGNKGLHDLAEEAGSYAERGFRRGKIKVGRMPAVMLTPLPDTWSPGCATVSLEEAIGRGRAAREALGLHGRLAIDANNAWTPTTVIQMMHALAEQRIAWLEEPVWTEDVAGSAQVAQVLDVPVAGSETATGLAGYRDLIIRRSISCRSMSSGLAALPSAARWPRWLRRTGWRWLRMSFQPRWRWSPPCPSLPRSRTRAGWSLTRPPTPAPGTAGNAS
ncbi:MAG: hypothetical protein KC432_17125, partial [Thermomicrobiales bacterium]|nr:hypothetical protein [Thermomicrobiales bacterium]